MKTYKNALDKIHASDSFRRETAQMLVDRQRGKRRFRFAPVAAIAASLAVVIALGAVFFPMSKENKSFVITANAAELNDNSFTTIGELPASGWWSNWDFSREDFTAEISNGVRSDFMLNIEGSNIEKVTYSVKHGAIAVPDKNTRLIDSKEAPDFDYALQTEGRTLYSQITTSYDNQIDTTNDNADIVFYTYENSDELRSIVRNFVEMNEKTPWVGSLNPDEAKECTQKYFDAVVDKQRLDITVTYKDGTSETKSLKMSTDVDYEIQHTRYSGEQATEGEAYRFRVNLTAKIV